MTLTELGIQYICMNFGDNNNCCVKTGLSWYYISGGTQYNENGGTAQVVSRLASGLVNSVTMTNPARGTFTQAELNTANNGVVTIQDCQTITEHDTPDAPGGQWCYSDGGPPPQPPGPNLILIGAAVAAVCIVGIVFMVGKR